MSFIDDVFFSLKKIGSEESKAALETARRFEENYEDYYSKKNEDIKENTTQWGMYSLELNKKRLDDNDISMNISISHTSQEVVYASRDGKYVNYQVFSPVIKKLDFIKDNKCIKKYKKQSEFSLDVIESVHSEDMYSCPRCGNSDTVENFYEGCKYCGSKFNFEDFKNKVNSFRFKDTGMVALDYFYKIFNNFGKIIAACAALGLLGYILICILLAPLFGGATPIKEDMLPGILTWTASGAGMGAVLVPVFTILFGILVVMFINPIITHRYSKDTRSNNKYIKLIRERDKAFSEEGFGCILNNRMQLVYTANTPTETDAFLNCDIGDIIQSNKDVVFVYLDRYRITNYYTEDEFEKLKLYAVMKLYRFDGKKIKIKKEKLGLILVRSTAAYTQVLNDKVHLSCPNCGATLSLQNGGKCLHCYGKLNLVDVDWVIENISRIK